ncbi:DUF7278 family profilin-like fold-containing protein [Enterococcus sp. LJL98]
MNFFDALEWRNWKNLSDELRMQVMNQVLMYFVSPLKYVSDVTYKEFALSGIKCQTFECSIDGERFVLIPGNKEAILGWNIGTQGLPVTTWDVPATNQTDFYKKAQEAYQLETTEDWDVFVNESTSALRKVAISPMLVQKRAIPAGTKAIGEFNLVTGEFHGEVADFLPIDQQLRARFKQPQSLEESLSMPLPTDFFEEGQYYGRLIRGKDAYALFTHDICTHRTLRQSVHDQVFDLLTEDEWEYAVGGGTRRLFRWGNDLGRGENAQGRQVSRRMQAENMFGLVVDSHRRFWEMTDSNHLKLEKQSSVGIPLFDYLPLASYYRSRQILSEDTTLHPSDYSYRKAIVIREK